MTCVAGMVHGPRVFIAADSAGINGALAVESRTEPKVFRLGKRFVIGFAGSFRIGQLIKHAMEPPAHPRGLSVEAYMTTRFVPALGSLLTGQGALSVENGVAALEDTALLVGYRGQLFKIEPDLQVGQSARGYAAIGCGDDLALGSLHTSARMDAEPEQRLVWALEASVEHNAGVRPPFTMAVL